MNENHLFITIRSPYSFAVAIWEIPLVTSAPVSQYGRKPNNGWHQKLIMTRENEKLLQLIVQLHQKVDRLEFPPSSTPYPWGKGETKVKNEKTGGADPLAQWVDGQELMQSLHVSPRTLATLRANGTLPHSRIGGKLYYNRRDVAELLRNNYVMFTLNERGHILPEERRKP